MRKRFVSFALMATLTTPVLAANSVSLDELQANGYESVVATKDQTPRFTFHAPKGLNPAHFLGGVAGIVMHAKAAERGLEVLEEYKVVEPAVDIAKGLANLLSDNLKLANDYKDSGLASSASSSHFTLRSAKDLASEYGPGKLVVNVGTQMWTLQGTSKSKFRVMYFAKAQIADTSRPDILASSECVYPLKKGDAARDAATMFDNDAASLKAEFREVTEFCLAKFKSDLLGL